MKNLLLTLTLSLCAVISQAKIYYVASNGNNSNAGTISAPFATWEKLSSVMVAGDIAYIRGGTYRTPKAGNASVHILWQNLNGTSLNPIKIWAYPGEYPVFNLDNITPTYSDPTAVILSNSAYVHIKGLRITGFKQISNGAGVTRGFDLQNAKNCTIEFTEVDNIGGYGIIISNGSNDNYFLNCDAHHLDDRYTVGGAWGNANGFQCTGGVNATRNTFEGCRTWWCSDDGFDFFGTNGINTLKNCWAFWNGYIPGTFTPVGDGDGFKLGPDESYIFGGSSTVHNTLLRTLTNCVSFENKQHGFNQNVGDMKYKLYNNTSYKNGNTGYMWDFVSPAPVQDFKNNITINDYIARRGAETNGSFNSWSGGVTCNAADFLSLSSVGMDGPRGADGSLPVLNFLRLAPSSDLINSGINVGLPFVGSAPDRGAFEDGYVLPVKLLDLTGIARSGAVLLQWATVSEVNSDRFIVERSADGVHFTALGTVNAFGNSSSRIDYNFTDATPLTGTGFYRLRMVDQDAQYQYSKTITVTFRESGTATISIVTSDMTNNMLSLDISSVKQQAVKISLYDTRGRLVFVTSTNLLKGMNTIEKPVFVPGAVYYCKVAGNEEVVTTTILKR